MVSSLMNAYHVYTQKVSLLQNPPAGCYIPHEMAALQEWTAARGKTVTYVQKGQYTLSEHYRFADMYTRTSI